MSAMLTLDEVLDDIAQSVEGGAFTADDGATWECRDSVLDPRKPLTRILLYRNERGFWAQVRVTVAGVST